MSFPPGLGGGGIQASRLVRALAEKDVSVQVLTALRPGSNSPRREQGLNPCVERLPLLRSPRLQRHCFGLLVAVWLLLHRAWDILHLSGFFHFQVLPLLVARLRRRPVLIKVTEFVPGVSLLHEGHGLARWFQARLAGADRVIATSQAIADALERDGVPRRRVTVIPNGVDDDRFRPAGDGARRAARTRLGLPQNLPIVLSCGFLTRRKNAIALARAVARLGDLPVCLVLAGPDGSDPAYLADLDAALRAIREPAQVLRLGVLKPESIPELMQAADVFALVSHWEGLPNVLLEAMATGLACLASDLPGVAHLLDGGRGLVVNPDDIEAVSESLRQLLLSPDLRARLGRSARSFVEAKYSLSAVAGRYRALYDELLRRSRESHSVNLGVRP